MRYSNRLAVRLLGAGGAIATLGSCESGDITFPTQPVSCSLSAPTQLVGGSTKTLSVSEAQVAIQDIVTRIVPSLPGSPDREVLATRLSGLNASIGQASALSQCLGIEAARRALAALPASPETAPDRVVIEVTLDLLAASATKVSQ